MAQFLPVGRFLEIATRNSGLSFPEVAALLKGSTEVSTGIAGDELKVLADAIKSAGLSKTELEAMDPADALAKFRENTEISAALDSYLAITGQMLIGGYCISEKTLQESPNIILARISDAMNPKTKARNLMNLFRRRCEIKYPPKIKPNLILVCKMQEKQIACGTNVAFIMIYGVPEFLERLFWELVDCWKSKGLFHTASCY